ncbi:MAG: gluconokinase, GntK/IdnK-type [Gammaproteobacteria bacterium]
MIIIVMGVSGAGKTTVGKALAERLGWRFCEGDDFHPAANVDKMARGKPLTDDDRAPWLARLGELIRELLDADESAVLSCSALKLSYRKQLLVDDERVQLVFLAGSFDLILERLKMRVGHFMKEGLLKSQFEDLEIPFDAASIDIDQSPHDTVEDIMCALELIDNSALPRVLADGLMFPEAPRWHRDRLWFTDQHARQVLAVDLHGNLEIIAETDDLPGGLGWLPDGSLAVVSMTEREVLRLRDGRVETYADLSRLASFHCNDMLIDAHGRAYVGNFGYDLHAGADVAPAEVIMIDSDGHARVVADDLIFPNGMILTPDGKMLVVAETFAARLTAFDVAPDGSLSNRRTWADLGDARPDGICLDADGAVWVASPSAGAVMRVSAGGETDIRIEPAGTPYACMLGGSDRRTLFVMTSETDDPERARELKSGRVEVVDVAVPGAGLP